MDPEGVTLHGPSVCEALGEKGSEAQALSGLLRQISHYFRAQEANLPSGSSVPQQPKVDLKKCCRLVDIFCNYNLITLAYRHLNSQGLGFR